MKTTTVEYLEPEGREKITHSQNTITLTLDIGHEDSFSGNLKSNADHTFQVRRYNMLYDYSDIYSQHLWEIMKDGFTSAMNTTFASSNAEAFTNTAVVIANVSIDENGVNTKDIENLFMIAVPKVLRNL